MARHALLSASSSHRWIHCPPSIRLGEKYENRGSEYAAEGTEAHLLCEYRLKQMLGIDMEDPVPGLQYYSKEMEANAEGYAQYVMEIYEKAKESCEDPIVLIEQQVSYERWVRDGFGTADALVVADGTLHVIDYKNGKGVLVECEDNSQMRCYGLGSLQMFDGIYDIQNIEMTIYQPNRDNISTCMLVKEDLLEWADTVLAPAAALAFEGKGEYSCGEWCQFCPVKHICRARADKIRLRRSGCPGGRGYRGYSGKSRHAHILGIRCQRLRLETGTQRQGMERLETGRRQVEQEIYG